MKNLLITASSAKRLKHYLEPLSDSVQLYEMSDDGEIKYQGTTVQFDQLDIHLGWFNHDVIASPINRDYAIAMLKSANLEWMQSLSAGLDDPFFKS